VKKRLTIALAAAALAATATSLMAAGLYQRSRAQATAADVLPAYEILNSMRALGFKPTTQALRRGPYYVMHAIDPRGVEVRLVADAQLGDIVSVAPVLAPRFNGGPRIIHVPQPGERDDRSNSTYENDGSSIANENDDADVDQPAPPPRPVRRPSQRMEAPPARASTDPVPPLRTKPEPKPLGPPRNVLSAPPPPAGGLTPIYPTPKFEPKSEPVKKFAPPEERSQPMPPPGYMPAPPSRG
jgi:hypothetical protein